MHNLVRATVVFNSCWFPFLNICNPLISRTFATVNSTNWVHQEWFSNSCCIIIIIIWGNMTPLDFSDLAIRNQNKNPRITLCLVRHFDASFTIMTRLQSHPISRMSRNLMSARILERRSATSFLIPLRNESGHWTSFASYFHSPDPLSARAALKVRRYRQARVLSPVK